MVCNLPAADRTGVVEKASTQKNYQEKLSDIGKKFCCNKNTSEIVANRLTYSSHVVILNPNKFKKTQNIQL